MKETHSGWFRQQTHSKGAGFWGRNVFLPTHGCSLPRQAGPHRCLSQIAFQKRLFNLLKHLNQIFTLYSRAPCQRHTASWAEEMVRACVNNQGGLSLQCLIWGQLPVDRHVDRPLGRGKVTAKLNPDWPHGWVPARAIILYSPLAKESIKGNIVVYI